MPRTLPAALLLALALAGLCVAAVGPAYVNHDAAWYLYMADRWIDGATLYRDVVDTNPPLIVWLSTPPVLAARAIGASQPAMFKLYVFAIAAGMLAMALRIAGRSWPGRSFPVVACVAFLALPFAKGDFGQREHFAVLLTLPYILMTASPLRFRAGESWLAGVAAGLGFAIKPHFLAAWLLVESVAFAYDGARRLRRIEAVAVVATFLAYGLIAMATAREYLVVAAQVRELYGGLNSSFAALLRLKEVQLWVAAAAVLAAVRWPQRDRLPVVIFSAATGYLLAALLQLKGWGYQLYPARVFIVLFLVIAAVTVLDAAPALAGILRGGRRGLAVVFAAVLVVSAARYALEARHPTSQDLVTPLIETIRARAPEGPIAVLGMHMFIYPAFPAVNYTRATWSLRHNSLVFLAGLYADELRGNGPVAPHPLERMTATERLLFDQVVDDLCRVPPRLLLLEEAPEGRHALDIPAYLGQSPRLAGLLQAFGKEGTLGPFTVLTASRGVAACR